MTTDKPITKNEIKYWLGNDYPKWIANVILDLVNDNDPNDLIYLKKEIKKANQDSKDAHTMTTKANEIDKRLDKIIETARKKHSNHACNYCEYCTNNVNYLLKKFYESMEETPLNKETKDKMREFVKNNSKDKLKEVIKKFYKK